ncbi:sugar-binding transcriptional regulator [Aliagarivorans marinus]|uniref:sugar-binding transcriptional regulator n=1 Tax=Aliagarivorans marinus TaxID=561965 RepID=UPI00041D70B2|nr:sugar-binding transcriptional regulator [Aliagarivorans marinus]
MDLQLPDETDLLTEIAMAYYQNGATQEEISKRFAVSRIKVGRLLRKAREEGIVEITVKYHPVFSANLEQQLIDRFGIKRALIALDQPHEEEQRSLVAGLVSGYLSNALTDDTVVTVGQGRNISAVAEYMGVTAKRNCRFVCGIGGIHPRGGLTNADHICRQLVKKFGGSSETLYAPAFVNDPTIRASLMANPTITQTLDLARKADMALVGVGDMSSNSYMVDLGWFSAQEVSDARMHHGVIGDIAGYDFFDIHGNTSHNIMSDRIIGLNIEEFKQIPEVIAVASESSKSLSLLGALRTGVIDVLATSVSNAMAIINLDDLKQNKA